MARNHYHSFLSKADNRVDLSMSIDDFKSLYFACVVNRDLSACFDRFVIDYCYFFNNI